MCQMVAYTMEAVCILFGCKPNWKESKNLLSKMTFMDELKVRNSGPCVKHLLFTICMFSVSRVPVIPGRVQIWQIDFMPGTCDLHYVVERRAGAIFTAQILFFLLWVTLSTNHIRVLSAHAFACVETL